MENESKDPRTDIPPLASAAADCPLHLAINAIGGRWKLHILRSLLLHGAQRYNRLHGQIENISSKELTRNLRELENAGLVQRHEGDGEQRYALTALGTELLPAFRSLGTFGTLMASAKGLSRKPHVD